MVRWLIVLGLWWCSAAVSAAEKDWGPIDQRTREWFRNAAGPYGVCCDQRDGVPTDWEIRADGYYVPVPWMPSGQWVRVDPRFIVSGNPTDVAIIWYTTARDGIRCFAPGGGF
jgi:hypothetical protein